MQEMFKGQKNKNYSPTMGNNNNPYTRGKNYKGQYQQKYQNVGHYRGQGEGGERGEGGQGGAEGGRGWLPAGAGAGAGRGGTNQTPSTGIRQFNETYGPAVNHFGTPGTNKPFATAAGTIKEFAFNSMNLETLQGMQKVMKSTGAKEIEQTIKKVWSNISPRKNDTELIYLATKCHRGTRLEENNEQRLRNSCNLFTKDLVQMISRITIQ